MPGSTVTITIDLAAVLNTLVLLYATKQTMRNGSDLALIKRFWLQSFKGKEEEESKVEGNKNGLP